MTKAELIERIIDRITDPWTESCEDYADAEPITLDYAKSLLETYREGDEAAELEPDERMPEEATPELLMEAHNCYVKKMKHDLCIKRFAEWLIEREDVALHDNYYTEYENSDPCVVPCNFLDDTGPFYFTNKEMTSLEYYDLFKNSRYSFDPDNDEYCWYDKDNNKLVSTNTPYRDGIIDAEAMARYFLYQADADTLEYVVSDMEDDEKKYIFGC